MDAKKICSYIKQFTFIRVRGAHLRLWGNLRWGLYRDYCAGDIIFLIAQFGKKTAVPENSDADETTTAPIPLTFKSGTNYAILSRLCEQYYVYEGSDKKQKKIIAEVEDIINELRNDQEAQREFEATIDAQCNGAMQQIRATHPELREKDFQLYSYLVAGLSATTIAVLLGKEKSVVYNRISRLKKAIKE